MKKLIIVSIVADSTPCSEGAKQLCERYDGYLLAHMYRTIEFGNWGKLFVSTFVGLVPGEHIDDLVTAAERELLAWADDETDLRPELEYAVFAADGVFESTQTTSTTRRTLWSDLSSEDKLFLQGAIRATGVSLDGLTESFSCIEHAVAYYEDKYPTAAEVVRDVLQKHYNVVERRR